MLHFSSWEKTAEDNHCFGTSMVSWQTGIRTMCIYTYVNSTVERTIFMSFSFWCWNEPSLVYQNSNLASRLRRIKQKKFVIKLSFARRFLLFYFPKPRSQVRILTYRNWAVDQNSSAENKINRKRAFLRSDLVLVFLKNIYIKPERQYFISLSNCTSQSTNNA